MRLSGWPSGPQSAQGPSVISVRAPVRAGRSAISIRSASGHPSRPIPTVNHPMLPQPPTSILSIPVEPRPRASQPEAIPPSIHVGAQPPTPHPRQLIRQQHLQITNRGLLQIIPTRIPIQPRPTLRRHTNVMTRLMQNRMNGRIQPRIQPIPLQPRLAIPPVRPRNNLIRRNKDELHPIATQHHRHRNPIDRTQ